jgi:hypothetical protein
MPANMKPIILSFISIFDLFEFKKQTNIVKAEVKVNLLIGYFTPSQIEVARNFYKAKIVDDKKMGELLN